MSVFLIALDKFFQWIVLTSVMGSMLVGFLLIIKKLLGRQLSTQWHYILWCLVIVRLSLPISVESPLSFYNFVEVPYSKEVAMQAQEKGEEPKGLQSIQESNVVVVDKPSKPTSIPSQLIEKMKQNQFGLLPTLWVLIALFVGMQQIRINRRFKRLIQRSKVSVNGSVLEIFSQCKQEMGMKGKIYITASEEVKTPILLGSIRPFIILPANVIHSFTHDQLRYIFLHELSHVKRKDLVINGIMNVLLVLHWFNPILWYAYHRMREDQELACDALAMTYIQPEETKRYGRTIISLLESFSGGIYIPGTARLSGTKKQLKRRITMIQQFKKKTFWSVLGVTSLLALGVLFLTNANPLVIPKSTAAGSETTVPIENAKLPIKEEVQKTPIVTEKNEVKYIEPKKQPESVQVKIHLSDHDSPDHIWTKTLQLKSDSTFTLQGAPSWAKDGFSDEYCSSVHEIQLIKTDANGKKQEKLITAGGVKMNKVYRVSEYFKK